MNLLDKAMRGFGALMLLIYYGMGLLFLFSKNIDMNPAMKNGIGIAVLLYAVFRTYQFIKKIRGEKEYEEEDGK